VCLSINTTHRAGKVLIIRVPVVNLILRRPTMKRMGYAGGCRRVLRRKYNLPKTEFISTGKTPH
jgi:hypothetical protein